jgi:hypothetical protein
MPQVQMVDELLIKSLAAASNGVAENDRAKGDDGHFRCASATIHNHSSPGLVDLEVRTDRGQQWLGQEFRFSKASVDRRCGERLALSFSRIGWYAYQSPSTAEAPCVPGPTGSKPNEFTSSRHIAQHAVPERAHNLERPSRPPDQIVRFRSRRDEFRVCIIGFEAAD